jgi:hypothetical protein
MIQRTSRPFAPPKEKKDSHPATHEEDARKSNRDKPNVVCAPPHYESCDSETNHEHRKGRRSTKQGFSQSQSNVLWHVTAQVKLSKHNFLPRNMRETRTNKLIYRGISQLRMLWHHFEHFKRPLGSERTTAYVQVVNRRDGVRAPIGVTSD